MRCPRCDGGDLIKAHCFACGFDHEPGFVPLDAETAAWETASSRRGAQRRNVWWERQASLERQEARELSYRNARNKARRLDG